MTDRKEKFTPGPWKEYYNRDLTRFDICQAETLDIVGHANDRHDARLIAAAPEMYEALQAMKSAMLDVLDVSDLPDDILTAADDALEKAEKAMQKARGEE